LRFVRLITMLLVVLMPAHPAVAHALGESTKLTWTWDPWVTVPLGIALLWFAAGYYRLSARSTHPSTHRAQAFWFGAGWLVLAAALVTPLHEAGARSFTAHMLEHELLMLVAAPLLIMSRPVGIALWALSHATRLRLAQYGHGAVGRLWRTLTDPVVATFVQAVALWAWHAPAAFDRALSNPGWHIVQHLCFLVSALLFWWSMLQRRGHHAAVSVVCLFITSAVGGALGALMAFSSGPWYRGYSDLGLDAFGLSPAEDQQLAGVLMWVPGGLIHAAVGVALLAGVLKIETSKFSGSAANL
jgi:putative membrane protein